MQNNAQARWVSRILVIALLTLTNLPSLAWAGPAARKNTSPSSRIMAAPQLLQPSAATMPPDVRWDSTPIDREDEQMNQYLTLLATGLTTFIGDEGLRRIVQAEVGKSPDFEAAYTALVTRDRRFKTLMNAYLERAFNPTATDSAARLGSLDRLQYIDDHMTYRGVDYFPNFSIPNFEKADFSRVPIIAAGIEVAENEETGEDYIAGWELLPRVGWRQVLLSEEMALKHFIPIIIVNNGTTHVEESCECNGPIQMQPSSDPGAKLLATLASWREYNWTFLRIHPGYHYEKPSFKADIAYQLTFHDDDGNYLSGNSEYQNGVHFGLIRKIKKADSDNDTPFYIQKQMLPDALAEPNALDYPRMFLTIYERDWWAGGKYINSCGNLLNVNGYKHKCHMKYAHEWYYKMCNVEVNAGILFAPGNVMNFANQKSEFAVTRIN